MHNYLGYGFRSRDFVIDSNYFIEILLDYVTELFGLWSSFDAIVCTSYEIFYNVNLSNPPLICYFFFDDDLLTFFFVVSFYDSDSTSL